ncbi:MAG: TSUP family transporter, partial [Pseudomonadota bacterium]
MPSFILDADLAVFHSPVLLVVICIVIMTGAVFQVGLGMGFGLTVGPLLALVDPALVPGPTLVLGFFTALIAATREREHIVWSEVRTGFAGRLAGVGLAMVALSFITNERQFMLIFGVMVGVAVALSVAGWRLAFTTRSLVVMTVVSGF